MISLKKYILNNGLKVILHKDESTPIVTVNTLYNVGARDEQSDKTGFAHLFEHLMFGGSENIPVFDKPLQIVGGENNAFTNSNFTNYYITLPKENIETALWLESDRMLKLDFSEKKLNIQKNVVIEEYKQRYLNQPYGDVWLLLKPLAYKKHPYRWATIGKDISHIEKAKLKDVKDFFYKYYAPNNAILVVAGNIDFDETEHLINKWFGAINKRNIPERNLPVEPVQNNERKLKVERNVPYDAIFKVYHMCARNDKKYHSTDLLSDILSNGKSSRLYQSLVKEKKLFSDIDAYITGDIDEGLFIISGKLIKNIKMDTAENAINEEINKIKNSVVSDYELNKVKNKIESITVFLEMSVLTKAMNLAYFELIGDANNINNEVKKYLSVSKKQIHTLANEILQEKNCSTLYYYSK
ncbi:MAG: insulinase family protein [Bacteroidales bacterium]|nr:insulinase family protein [Bacteroidales bacterium]